MTIKRTDDANYTAIANAIRAKLGSQQTWTPAQMPDAIMDITTGGQRYTHGIGRVYLHGGTVTASAEGQLI